MSRWEKWAELPHQHVVKLLHEHDGEHRLHALCLEGLSQKESLCWDLPFLKSMKLVAGNSCGGLLFFYDYCDSYCSEFLLFNPTTNKLRLFSFSSNNNKQRILTYALGYDLESDEYKVLRVCRGDSETHDLCAEVYSFETDKQYWRRITGAPKYIFTCFSDHIYVAGKSYWSAVGSHLVSFDYSKEEFSNIEFPPLPYLLCNISRVLVKLHDGLLGVVCYWRRGSGDLFDDEYPGNYYELWAWREEEREWYRMFDPVCLCGGAREPLGLIDGRLLLLRGLFNHDKTTDNTLLVYNWTTKQCFDPRLYIGERISGIAKVFSYVETTDELPPPPQGEGQISYVETTDELPPHPEGQRQGELTQPPPPQQQPPPQARRKPCLPLLYRLGNVYRGDDGKVYEYKKPAEDIEYEDWSINGFRVVDVYHPSEDRYVFDFESFERNMLVQIRERGRDYPDDDDVCYMATMIKYIDELEEMKIDDGPRQRKQPIEHDNKRTKREDPTTVYAYGIPMGKLELDVRRFFSKAGKVKTQKYLIDEKSRVVWCIEFYDCGSVPMARALSGHPGLGQAFVVLDELVNCAQRLPRTQTFTKTILLQNLPSTVLAWHLYELFSRFGKIIRIIREGNYAYVKFHEAEFANEAQLLDGHLQMADESIEVTLVEDISDGVLDCGGDYAGSFNI